jgi:hypothetical protein
MAVTNNTINNARAALINSIALLLVLVQFPVKHLFGVKHLVLITFLNLFLTDVHNLKHRYLLL